MADDLHNSNQDSFWKLDEIILNFIWKSEPVKYKNVWKRQVQGGICTSEYANKAMINETLSGNSGLE